MGKKFSPSKDPCHDWKANKLVNPRTGRTIKEHGPTFRKLEIECRETRKIKLWGFNRFYRQARSGSKTIEKFISEVKPSDFIAVPLGKFKAEEIAEALKKYNKDSKLNLEVARLYLDTHKIL